MILLAILAMLAILVKGTAPVRVRFPGRRRKNPGKYPLTIPAPGLVTTKCDLALILS